MNKPQKFSEFMKFALLVIVMVLNSFAASSQISNSFEKEVDCLSLICKVQASDEMPLFIVLLKENRIELNRPEYLSQIDLAWIEDLKVLKGDEAVQEFGSKAANGVIFFEIKEKYINDLKSKLRSEQSKNN